MLYNYGGALLMLNINNMSVSLFQSKFCGAPNILGGRTAADDPAADLMALMEV